MNKSNFARDVKSKAVVSVDSFALTEYKRTKSVLRQKEKKMNELEDRLTKLESIISQLMETK